MKRQERDQRRSGLTWWFVLDVACLLTLLLALAPSAGAQSSSDGSPMSPLLVIAGLIALGGAVGFVVWRARARETRGAARGEGTGAYRECCFFCSKPLPPDEQASVWIPLADEHREVTACAEHAERISTGMKPSVAAVDGGGTMVPWFAAPAYNPYHDYQPVPAASVPLTVVAAQYLTAALALASAPASPVEMPYQDNRLSFGPSAWNHDRHDRDDRWPTRTLTRETPTRARFNDESTGTSSVWDRPTIDDTPGTDESQVDSPSDASFRDSGSGSDTSFGDSDPSSGSDAN